MLSDQFNLAKNLVLSGVKGLTIHDKSPVILSDLSAQYYLKTTHLGHARDAASLESLSDLNRNVQISVFPKAEISNIDVALFNVLLRSHSIYLILSRSLGCYFN